jgi:hypothetical protein
MFLIQVALCTARDFHCLSRAREPALHVHLRATLRLDLEGTALVVFWRQHQTSLTIFPLTGPVCDVIDDSGLCPERDIDGIFWIDVSHKLDQHRDARDARLALTADTQTRKVGFREH